jgi:O-succinylbenzoate synthase
MAVADAELRAVGRSLASDLGVTEGFEALAVGAVVGIPEGHDVGLLRQEVDAVVRSGAARVRLKVEPGWELEPVRAVRADHPDVVLQVDANGSFGTGDEDVAVLSRLAEFDVLCIEQPLPPADLVAHALLARLLPVPICLDESLSTPRRVTDALRNGSCAMACLKPARLGGVRATRAAHAACAAAGVPVFVGGFFEAGLGRSSNLALAARLSQDATGLVSDVGDPAGYLAVDPCGYPPVRSGWVRVPAGPGVGNPPEGPVLERLEARRRWFPATYT